MTLGNGSASRKFAAATLVVACKYHHEGREEHEVYKKSYPEPS
jgi:predicted small metal-binding protein